MAEAALRVPGKGPQALGAGLSSPRSGVQRRVQLPVRRAGRRVLANPVQTAGTDRRRRVGRRPPWQAGARAPSGLPGRGPLVMRGAGWELLTGALQRGRADCQAEAPVRGNVPMSGLPCPPSWCGAPPSPVSGWRRPHCWDCASPCWCLRLHASCFCGAAGRAGTGQQAEDHGRGAVRREGASWRPLRLACCWRWPRRPTPRWPPASGSRVPLPRLWRRESLWWRCWRSVVLHGRFPRLASPGLPPGGPSPCGRGR
ncbi:hypothetical protein SAMN04489738_3520 [Pseudarthrobacter chlorophenolicus]|nr:hypothetical protein SAMN04489738_3520 [Pseudarthrobacter chlorophenolicus]